MTSTAEAPANVLVMAKAPVAGRVKTRLGRDLGMDFAAELAAAALLDTIDACAAYSPHGCFLALSGDLRGSVRGLELAARLTSWTIFEQVGETFAERLANAHGRVSGPVIQVGMDTPQATAMDLHRVVTGLADHDAVLAPAVDGGWWALALRDPCGASSLRVVPMSTAETFRHTRAALEMAGLRVGTAPELVDVDTQRDAALVAGMTTGAFARAWSRHQQGVLT